MGIEEVQNKKVLGMIGLSTKAGKLVSGTDATIQEIEKNKVALVIVAKDASEKTKKNMKFICDKSKINFIEFGEIENLSRAIGKNNKAIIGIKSKNIAIEIERIIKGGDLLNG